MSIELLEAKEQLIKKLGTNYGIYVQLLGRWFRGHIAKDEFDKSAKELIKQDFVLEHNKFWLAFFHHCASNATNSIANHNLHNTQLQSSDYGAMSHNSCIDGVYPHQSLPSNNSKVKCLPSKVMTHMKIFVIAWEMGLESADDNVSTYISLALQYFLKNIITELICTKTAYRLRENRFKHAIGVKPINPYLSNSLKIYNSILEYDPYQIESNKMNSSLVDTYAYNDSLFPSRLYEAQALYEYACSTTSVTQPTAKKSKRLKMSDVILNQFDEPGYNNDKGVTTDRDAPNLGPIDHTMTNGTDTNGIISIDHGSSSSTDDKNKTSSRKAHGLSLFHLLMAFLANRTIIPSQSLYSINLERIFTKLSC